MHFEESVLVRRSPEQVGRFFADYSNLPRWDRGVARVEITSAGPSGLGSVGTTFDTVGYQERGRMSYRITEINPDHSYTVVTHSSFFKEAQWRIQLLDTPEGTQIFCSTDFSLKWQYLILAPILLLSAKRGAIRTDLEYLKSAVEAA